MNSMNLAELIKQAGLTPIAEIALNRFDLYLGLLLKWNSRLNLTAIREPESIQRRHFVECIQCSQALPSLRDATLLDFGSGAGLPGIPIAICRPEIRVTLAESQGKKSAFLREVLRTLNLPAEVFDGRVEDIPERRQFDFVTLRAVDQMRDSCKAAYSRIKPNGWILVFSTREAVAELQQTLPAIRWVPNIPSAGLDRGLLLIGQCIKPTN